MDKPIKPLSFPKGKFQPTRPVLPKAPHHPAHAVPHPLPLPFPPPHHLHKVPVPAHVVHMPYPVVMEKPKLPMPTVVNKVTNFVPPSIIKSHPIKPIEQKPFIDDRDTVNITHNHIYNGSLYNSNETPKDKDNGTNNSNTGNTENNLNTGNNNTDTNNCGCKPSNNQSKGNACPTNSITKIYASNGKVIITLDDCTYYEASLGTVDLDSFTNVNPSNPSTNTGSSIVLPQYMVVDTTYDEPSNTLTVKIRNTDTGVTTTQVYQLKEPISTTTPIPTNPTPTTPVTKQTKPIYDVWGTTVIGYVQIEP